MMKNDQVQRYLCKFCNKSFVSGKSLGGHMRGHLALISAERDQAVHNGKSVCESLKDISKKASRVSEPSDAASVKEEVNESQMGVEDGGGLGSYGLRENPKKSWRVSDSSKRVALRGENVCKECGKGFHSLRALSGHMRSHSMKGKELLNCCKKCGKGFESMRAMYGHMRSHSKRSKQSCESEEEEEEERKPKTEPDFSTEEIANPFRKKRSRTRYKITPNPSCSSNLHSFSSIAETDEVEEVAMCLIMLSRGVRNWDDFNSGFGEFDSGHSRNSEFEVSVDESFEVYKLKNQSELGLEKDEMTEVDFGQAGLGLMRPSAGKKLRSNGQDFVYMGISCDQGVFDATETEIDALKKNKDHECSICFKVFGSGQALGGHKRAHYNGIAESKATETELMEQEFAEIHKLLNLNLSVNLEEGVKGDNAGFKTWWIGSDIEREPLVIL